MKTLDGKETAIQVGSAMKVPEIKEVVQTTLSVDVNLQKLIFKGKVLEDDTKSATDYGLKEGEFIVLMKLKKPAGAPKPQA